MKTTLLLLVLLRSEFRGNESDDSYQIELRSMMFCESKSPKPLAVTVEDWSLDIWRSYEG